MPKFMPRQENAPKGSWRPLQQYLNGIGDSLGNDGRVLETLSTALREYVVKTLLAVTKKNGG
jgi:hypothetical protein